jgi:hypothetical protein
MAERAHDLQRQNRIAEAVLELRRNVDLTYSDRIAAARTMIALGDNANRTPSPAPGRLGISALRPDDLRGSSLKGANMLVPCSTTCTP